MQLGALGPLKMFFKRSEGEGEGSYSMFESIEPPGASVDLHRHPAWQETFIVLEGLFDFEVAGDRRSLGPAGVFEAFVVDVSAANSDPTIDVRAVFAR